MSTTTYDETRTSKYVGCCAYVAHLHLFPADILTKVILRHS